MNLIPSLNDSSNARGDFYISQPDVALSLIRQLASPIAKAQRHFTKSTLPPPPTRTYFTMPDLNSVPPSPHVLPPTTSRRTASQQMPPPPVPISPSLNILPSNQNAVNQGAPSSALPSPQFAPALPAGPTQPSNSGPAIGPGPIRHPRPLTAADLHLQLEKEQEAVVWPPHES